MMELATETHKTIESFIGSNKERTAKNQCKSESVVGDRQRSIE